MLSKIPGFDEPRFPVSLDSSSGLFMKKRSPNFDESPAHFRPCSRSQGVLPSEPFLNLVIVSPAKVGIHVKIGSSCASRLPGLLSSPDFVVLICVFSVFTADSMSPFAWFLSLAFSVRAHCPFQGLCCGILRCLQR